ncbi:MULTISPECIES: aminotransferase class I/II-fold pyridoxal phosphate-dependent enzyme [unclassified Sphingomonas]|uniref:aminotransferase class I/II-fold pyridoxal phosphate-dependent enzyme n=1 Tax=unclassified Sphingomonas TaxID=196159 RepID=UPI002854CBC0|nr:MULTISPECIES: aminotransferase class I/II-fold pyridoxal phosphate-dependent enzyme [unclassified Sphingomonas]MDR6115013.1 cobalamin biosynthetic protein CobC [Sphingomonas sp. SORGH_AS_0789]MDR6151313.1 cobalamin biosynthetic protein CobC [Sphingomonas sp. SORGH_AS_0742]
MTQAEMAALTYHGGRIDAARALFPNAPAPWLDLSTGINPVPWTPPEGLDVDAGPLPDRGALARLEALAAAHFGVAAERVAAVPGSEMVLRLLPLLGMPQPIVALRPSYGTHGAIATTRVDHGALENWAGQSGSLLLANPNNPDGVVHTGEKLSRLAEAQARAGGWLILDEAFADAMPDPGFTGGERVVVLRSFGKFFGLAGVRLGFVIAAPALLSRLRDLLGDWPVSSHAMVWGGAAYADRAWIAATRLALVERAAALDAVLARHGLVAKGSCPLFRMVETPDAGSVFHRLAAAGILVRPFADAPERLRFGVPASVAELARLDKVLSHG